MAEVALRLVEDSDLDALFEQMRDPESVRMAAFIARDPNDREAFDAHVAKLRSSPDIILRAVTGDGRFLGTVGSFVVEGDAETAYWIDRSAWGQGIASQALALLLDIIEVRPLYARAASDNLGSLRVLEKAGFTVIGTDTGYALARDAEIEETVLRLG
ncbi:GNAT family N-acetyltransferase [Amycolatopsis azurea]|uniref:Acetyltransferase, GNAT family n=1 Tax=Amycolatopsis azurea DSM 43854 TaxID=1238180 RepID=M2PUZ7_9PSEU|nr:GNAT family N-acetyltransferase [Amycolatopsis azurea]EMD28418.1 Acetyltransferase, GNAT family [Amycolatopsis azurea DSM 43854]OOC06630.1 N-acetyltransferase [Amycolatopsis azurea DSM 43854]